MLGDVIVLMKALRPSRGSSGRIPTRTSTCPSRSRPGTLPGRARLHHWLLADGVVRDCWTEL